MTRSCTITNTSNWDAEDYIVTDTLGDVRLKPGESYQINAYDEMSIKIVPVQDADPAPFIDDEGKQYGPVVRVVNLRFEDGTHALFDHRKDGTNG